MAFPRGIFCAGKRQVERGGGGWGCDAGKVTPKIFGRSNRPTQRREGSHPPEWLMRKRSDVRSAPPRCDALERVRRVEVPASSLSKVAQAWKKQYARNVHAGL